MRRVVAALLFAMGFGVAMGQGAAAPLADPLAPVAWLADGVWQAEIPKPSGNGTTKVEQRMERMLDGKAIRFVTRFDGVVQYEGFFAYDAAKKQVVFAYPSASGDVTTGTAVETQEYLLMDFVITDAKGGTAHYEVHAKRAGADDYTWSLFGSANGALTPYFQVKYHRAG